MNVMNIVQAFAAAFIASAVICAIGYGLRRRFTPLALGVGFLAGYCVLLGLPTWPPQSANQRLGLLVVLALVIGLGEARWPLPTVARLLLHAGLGAAVAAVLLLPSFGATWSGLEITLTLLVLAGLGGVLGESFDLAVGGMVWVAVPLLLGGCAVLLAFTGSALLGLLAACTGMAYLPVAVTGKLGPEHASRGSVSVLLATVLGLTLMAHAFGETPRESLLLLLAVPITTWLLLVATTRPLPGWSGHLLRAAVPLGLVFLVVLPLLAQREEERSIDDLSPVATVETAPVASRPSASPRPASPPPTSTSEEPNPFERFTAPAESEK